MTQDFALPTWNSCPRPTVSENTEQMSLKELSTHYLSKGFKDKLSSKKQSGPLRTEDSIQEGTHGLAKYSKYIAKPITRYFRFYDKSEQLISWMTVIGLLIEQNPLDGYMIPIESTRLDLGSDNSHYLQGTIPLEMIRPINITKETQFEHIIRHTQEEEDGIGLTMAIHNHRISTIPLFTSISEDTSHEKYGLTITKGVTNLSKTVTNFSLNTEHELPTQQITAWSAFRTRHITEQGLSKTYLYLTFRPLYG